MDLLSQAVLGGCAAQAAVGHRLPRSAWLIGCAAGLLPDADVVIRTADDPLGGLLWHRHFTHALLLAPALALAVAGVAAVARPWRERFGMVFVASLVATLTHAPLDAATSYGTHLWWPFTNARTAWDILPILDPLVTLPATLLLALAAWQTWRAHRARSLSPVGAAPLSRSLAALGLLWFVAYAALGAVQHRTAERLQTELAASRGHAPLEGRRRTMPQPLSLLLWRSVYEYRDASTGRIMIATDFLRIPHWPYTLVGGDRAVPQALEGASQERLDRAALLARPEVDREADERIAETFDRFAFFCDGYVALSATRPLIVGDMRYAIGPESTPLWGLVIPTRGVFGSDLRMGQGIGPEGRRMTDRAGELWDALTGRSPALRRLDEPRSTQP